jgi:hypothetical protein
MLEPIIYKIQCILTGLCGSQRRMVFFGTFFPAIITTLLMVLPVLLITGPLRSVEWRRCP